MPTTLSPYFIPLCLLAGAIYAAALYLRDSRNDFPDRVRFIAAGLRFAVVSVLCFLLLSPMLRSVKTITERPVLMIAQDNSKSMVSNSDSATVRQRVTDLVSRLTDATSGVYDVKLVHFGATVAEGGSSSFDGEATDYSVLFDDLKTRLTNRGQSAVVLLSDGVYNRGADPVAATADAPFRVFTIGFGDTLPHRDVFVKKLMVNRIVYSGAAFPVEVVVNAHDMPGEDATVRLLVEGEKPLEQKIRIEPGAFSRSVVFLVTPSRTGLLTLSATISPVAGEFTRSNNRMVTFTEVLDSRRKVLLLGLAPHPDLGAIRTVLRSQYHLEVSMQLAPFSLPNPSDFNLIVCHQLPSVSQPLTDFLNKAREGGIPTLFVVGQGTSLPLFNNLLAPVTIAAGNNLTAEAVPVLNRQFGLFTLPQEAAVRYSQWPPLTVPFGEYKPAAGADVLMAQRINGVQTDRPLVVFGRYGSARSAVIVGEGLWRQRTALWMTDGSHELYDDWLLKTVQYLAVREVPTRFRVTGERSFQQFEAVTFDASLFNKSYEPVNEPEVQLVIRNEQNETFPFVFARAGTGYTLHAGRFPAGRYTWEASVEESGDKLTASGVLMVLPANLEMRTLQADHRLLYNLALNRGGAFVAEAQADTLVQLLLNSKKLKPVVFTEEHITDWVNLPWVLVIIVLWLTGEWVLRRWAGGY